MRGGEPDLDAPDRASAQTPAQQTDPLTIQIPHVSHIFRDGKAPNRNPIAGVSVIAFTRSRDYEFITLPLLSSCQCVDIDFSAADRIGVKAEGNVDESSFLKWFRRQRSHRSVGTRKRRL